MKWSHYKPEPPAAAVPAEERIDEGASSGTAGGASGHGTAPPGQSAASATAGAASTVAPQPSASSAPPQASMATVRVERAPLAASAPPHASLMMLSCAALLCSASFFSLAVHHLHTERR